MVSSVAFQPISKITFQRKLAGSVGGVVGTQPPLLPTVVFGTTPPPVVTSKYFEVTKPDVVSKLSFLEVFRTMREAKADGIPHNKTWFGGTKADPHLKLLDGKDATWYKANVSLFGTFFDALGLYFKFKLLGIKEKANKALEPFLMVPRLIKTFTSESEAHIKGLDVGEHFSDQIDQFKGTVKRELGEKVKNAHRALNDLTRRLDRFDADMDDVAREIEEAVNKLDPEGPPPSV